MKASAIATSDTAMPAEPARSRGRRPTLSTSAIATSVTTTFVTAVIVETRNASESSNPTERHSVVE